VRTDSAEAWALRARAELPADATKALASAEEALRLCPKYSVALNVSGNAQQKLGRFELAEDAYSQALWEAASYDAPRFNLGLSQLRRKDPAAVWTFTELIKRRPDYPNARLVRAQAHLQQGHAEEALADLEEEVRVQPRSADAWAALGQLREHLHRGDWKAAYCEAKKLGNAEAAKHCE
jgi:Tfp pilus assembly protein PilF